MNDPALESIVEYSKPDRSARLHRLSDSQRLRPHTGCLLGMNHIRTMTALPQA